MDVLAAVAAEAAYSAETPDAVPGTTQPVAEDMRKYLGSYCQGLKDGLRVGAQMQSAAPSQMATEESSKGKRSEQDDSTSLSAYGAASSSMCMSDATSNNNRRRNNKTSNKKARLDVMEPSNPTNLGHPAQRLPSISRLPGLPSSSPQVTFRPSPAAHAPAHMSPLNHQPSAFAEVQTTGPMSSPQASEIQYPCASAFLTAPRIPRSAPASALREPVPVSIRQQIATALTHPSRTRVPPAMAEGYLSAGEFAARLTQSPMEIESAQSPQMQALLNGLCDESHVDPRDAEIENVIAACNAASLEHNIMLPRF